MNTISIDSFNIIVFFQKISFSFGIVLNTRTYFEPFRLKIFELYDCSLRLLVSRSSCI